MKLGRKGRACKKIEQLNKANEYFFWLHACAPLPINHDFIVWAQFIKPKYGV
jgi:hypothetical protein